MNPIFLPHMTYEQIAEAIKANAVLLIPVACLEQHGRHLPIHTDIDNCAQITMGVARTLNPRIPVIVSESVWFSPGGSFPLATYAGTMRMRKEIFMEALSDLMESYLRHGFKRIIVINGHGGGTQLWIPDVIRYLRRDLPKLGYKDDWKMPADARCTAFTWPAILGEFAQKELQAIRKNAPGSDFHGGDIESSLQMYLRPELVHMDKARRGDCRVPSKFGTSDFADWHREFILINWPGKVEKGEEPYVTGDPTKASVELGKAIYELAVNKISELVEEFVELT